MYFLQLPINKTCPGLTYSTRGSADHSNKIKKLTHKQQTCSYANLDISSTVVQELYKAIHLALQQRGVNQTNYASQSFELVLPPLLLPQGYRLS